MAGQVTQGCAEPSPWAMGFKPVGLAERASLHHKARRTPCRGFGYLRIIPPASYNAAVMATPSLPDTPASATTPAARPWRRWLGKARRVMFNILCVISALLCLAAIIFGVRSFWFLDSGQIAYGCNWYAHYIGCVSRHGTFNFGLMVQPYLPSIVDDPPRHVIWKYRSFDVSGIKPDIEDLFKIQYYRFDTNYSVGKGKGWSLRVPGWMLAFLFAVPPIVWLWLYIRRRK